MDIVTIDMETFYDREFSLSKMTTESYVRSPLFEVIGVGVQVNDGEPEWFSGTKPQTAKWLQKFDWTNSIALAHNAMFDMAIMSWMFDIRPKRIADTLSMARALHGTEVGGSLAVLAKHYGLGEKGTEVLNALGKQRLDFTDEELARYGEYCLNDVVLTYKLFRAMVTSFPISELRLIDLTIRMFTEPVLELNEHILTEHLENVRDDKERLLAGITGSREELMSNPKFADLLRKCGVEPPLKVSPTTGKETYAFSKTDEGFKALLEHEDVRVQGLVAARLGVKSTIEETRTQRFVEIAQRGKLPIPLRYYAAHTGRWGGDDKVNMQNLPRSSPLKNAICAPEGYLLIDSDSSQIEARTLAWLAEQNDLVAAFDRGEDVYKIMASAIYGKPENEITKDERFVGKTTILGAGYGMGAKKFRVQLLTFGVDLPQEECERIISVYRETYPQIPKLWRQAGDALTAIMNNQTAPLGRDGVLFVEGLKGVQLPNGLYIKYPNLRKIINQDGKEETVYDTKRGKAIIPNRIYGGKVIENCIAEGTQVLTDRGWIAIEDVRVSDKVHDGVEFVTHGGVIFKSVQPCVGIDGVWMTSDHEVLTNEGWKTASQNPEPYRPDLRHLDCAQPRTQRWKEKTWVASRSTNTQAKPEKSVYDILNAGTRHRFVVRGADAPFIVHNCCQALARIAIGEQMLLISKKFRVVMTVHDAIACIVPESEVETGVEFVELAMRIRPEWAPDLPLNCESGFGESYGDC